MPLQNLQELRNLYRAATGKELLSASTVRREACKSQNYEFHIQNTTDQMSEGYFAFMRDYSFLHSGSAK